MDPRDLAHEIRSQLRTLSKLAADRVAKHLVAAGRLVDEDPAAALEHARAARALGARVAVVREAVGETAYAAGEWAEAIAELRTARRMTGDDSVLPLIADSERALGRADRALRIAQSPEALALEPAARAEMRIVEAGARRDLGQLDAALVTLEEFGLDRKSVEPWSPRLWYAYADILLAVGRGDEARDWFAAAASIDHDGTTDADDRILQLDGVEVLEDEDELPADEGDAGEGDADVDRDHAAPAAADVQDPPAAADVQDPPAAADVQDATGEAEDPYDGDAGDGPKTGFEEEHAAAGSVDPALADPAEDDVPVADLPVADPAADDVPVAVLDGAPLDGQASGTEGTGADPAGAGTAGPDAAEGGGGATDSRSENSLVKNFEPGDRVLFSDGSAGTGTGTIGE